MQVKHHNEQLSRLPPPPCPQPGPDCTYISPEADDCGCIYGCGEINCGETILPDPLNDCPIHQSDCINEFVCPKITEITHCTEGGIDGYTTYQLSLVIQDHNILNIYALFGDNINEDHQMVIPPAYQIKTILIVWFLMVIQETFLK